MDHEGFSVDKTCPSFVYTHTHTRNDIFTHAPTLDLRLELDLG